MFVIVLRWLSDCWWFCAALVDLYRFNHWWLPFLFHDLLSPPIFHHSVYGVITANNLTPRMMIETRIVSVYNTHVQLTIDQSWNKHVLTRSECIMPRYTNLFHDLFSPLIFHHCVYCLSPVSTVPMISLQSSVTLETRLKHVSWLFIIWCLAQNTVDLGHEISTFHHGLEFIMSCYTRIIHSRP